MKAGSPPHWVITKTRSTKNLPFLPSVKRPIVPAETSWAKPYLESMRQQMARILRDLPSAAWSRTAVHNERGLVTLDQMLQAEVEHVPHHIAHIIQKRRALGLSNSGVPSV